MLETESSAKRRTIGEVALLVILFFAYAGDQAPMVNEAHYLAKAKNFWQPEWCERDLFVASGKAHTTFYLLFGWPTKFVSLTATAWLGRLVGWTMLAIGLQRLSWRLLPLPFFSLGVAAVWIAGIEYGDLAGEWVVGGIEAKVPAYGFVLMAMADMVDRRWNRVWPLLGLASAFHVLSGGWSVLAAMLVWLATEFRRDDRQPFFTPALFLGGAISLFGLLPAVWLTMGVSPEDSAFSARVYSYFRLKHHLLPANLQTIWYLRHGVLIVATMAAFFNCRNWSNAQPWGRLAWFTIGAISIAAMGLLIGMLPQYAPDLAAKLLRYYWFRLTDAIVPLAFALITMRAIASTDAKPWQRIVGTCVLMVAVALIAHSSFSAGASGSAAGGQPSAAWPGRGCHRRNATTGFPRLAGRLSVGSRRDAKRRDISDAPTSANVQMVRRSRGGGELEGRTARRGELKKVVSALPGYLSRVAGQCPAWLHSCHDSIRGSAAIPSRIWRQVHDR